MDHFLRAAYRIQYILTGKPSLYDDLPYELDTGLRIIDKIIIKDHWWGTNATDSNGAEIDESQEIID